MEQRTQVFTADSVESWGWIPFEGSSSTLGILFKVGEEVSGASLMDVRWTTRYQSQNHFVDVALICTMKESMRPCRDWREFGVSGV